MINDKTSILFRVLSLASPFKGLFVLAALISIIMAILTPIRPILIQKVVDDYIVLGDYTGLVKMTFLLIGVLFAEFLIRYIFIYITGLLGQSVIRNLRIRVFRHLSSLNLRYFDTTQIGHSTTRTINDVETINDIFSQGVITIIADILAVISVIIAMLYYSVELTLVTLSVFPLLLLATYVFKEKVKVAFQRVRTQLSKMNSFLQEHISGMKIVQIFGSEDIEMKKFERINQSYTRENINTILYYAIFFPVVEIILAMAMGLVIWFGALEAIDGVGPGILIAFLMFLNLLFRPVRMLADKFNTLQLGLVAAKRVFDILDRRDKMENTGTIKADDIRGDITFEKVSFAYDEENYVLRNVSFELKAGQSIALVGATGSGKSSIINLINRFYENQGGNITVDGVNIRDYELYSLRSVLGNVLQDVFLFSGSIMDNITLRNKEMSRVEVIEASKICGIHEFIMRLPGNYDYNVMERGGTLSLGQRQLISFIRTLVYDPKVLILDEATSSIDSESEYLIQNAIEKLVTQRTSIIIAHRLSTIRNTDRILVLDKGEIKESGTHDSLLQQEGYYKKLYEMQFKDQEKAHSA